MSLMLKPTTPAEWQQKIRQETADNVAEDQVRRAYEQRTAVVGARDQFTEFMTEHAVGMQQAADIERSEQEAARRVPGKTSPWVDFIVNGKEPT